ncbi:cbs domain containing protein [Rufibacter sp. DG15C]|uniref:CBS domain-containing protein n=1 Tax=Rufibacter sp. DG15C TaxID=1379909 RepID=UPI00078D0632|nr:CBS domain-containing protein [Rufibacter sp. DG15C]AMM51085.1 cbs domain containing protein [Rufibacter sp. DG15C]
MIAEELINQMVPPLKLSDSGEKAVRWMEEFRLNQLPVVKNRKYLGLVTEDDVLEAKNGDLVLEQIPFDFEHVHVQQNQHFYSVMELAIKNKVQVVPVLDELHEYLGVITVSDTIAAFGQMSAMQGQGGILVLSMAERDYSLSEISRLVESNNAKILSAYVSPDEVDVFQMKLTLKINTADLTRIVATLERFGYKITAQFQDAGNTDEDQDRLDMLMRYLNV